MNIDENFAKVFFIKYAFQPESGREGSDKELQERGGTRQERMTQNKKGTRQERMPLKSEERE